MQGDLGTYRGRDANTFLPTNVLLLILKPPPRVPRNSFRVTFNQTPVIQHQLQQNMIKNKHIQC